MKAFREDCPWIENHLALWVGGDLETDQREQVDRHLAHCDRCRAAARRLVDSRRALVATLRDDGVRAPDLWPGIQASLRREGRFARGPLPTEEPAARRAESARSLEPVEMAGAGAGRSGRTRRWVGWGLAAAAALMVGLLLGRLGSTDSAVGVAPAHGPPSGSAPPELVVRDPSASRTGVVPVSNTGALRRLAPGEARLSDDAEIFGYESYSTPNAFGQQNIGSPASLQSAPKQR